MAVIAVFAFSTPAYAFDTVMNSAWAGYNLAPASGSYGAYEGVYEQTVLPVLTNRCSTDRWVSEWVGLGGGTVGGANDSPFVQAGFDQQEPDKNNAVWAWYELWDKNANLVTHYNVPLSDIRPSPGDKVSERVVWNHAHDTLWFVWNNLTTGGYAQRKVTNAGAFWNNNAAVDFIMEVAPSMGNVTWPWFDSETFTNAHAEQVGTDTNSNGVPIDIHTWSASNSQEKFVVPRITSSDWKIAPHFDSSDEAYTVNQNYCS